MGHADVVHHIMRRENFFIALHNRHLLDLRVCGKKIAWQTYTLYCCESTFFSLFGEIHSWNGVGSFRYLGVLSTVYGIRSLRRWRSVYLFRKRTYPASPLRTACGHVC